ncbi:MAG: hypothetical protein HY222_00535 [Thaumarchaeota archaeon]|nr:hypothetical protein [Nitrososphaerota archaeon]MBI3640873.1 hypothetical protein [Nitrososphaerota archaeon]
MVQLKRVDLHVFLRFLTVMNENTSIGITSLQMKTGTNHSACMKYVVLLERLELIRITINGKNKEMNMTEKGRQAFLMLSSCIQ